MNDGQEIGRLQRRTADQAAVDVRPAPSAPTALSGFMLPPYRMAILLPRCLRAAFAQLARGVAGMHCLRHRRRRRLAGADRPYGFVGQQRYCRQGVIGPSLFQHGRRFVCRLRSFVCSCFALFASVSPTQTIGVMPAFSRPPCVFLAPLARPISPWVGAAFRVADDYIAACRSPDQHRGCRLRPCRRHSA